MSRQTETGQNQALHREKMAFLGTLAAGLMHELNNPETAARYAALQLRENLTQLIELSARFARAGLTEAQKQCISGLEQKALAARPASSMNPLDSLAQSDAEESLARWMEERHIEDAWRIAPVLVPIGISAKELECVSDAFESELADALGWLDALASSLQHVATIEESVGRVSELVGAVKSYAYEGRGKLHPIDVNSSIHATLVILGYKLRAKEIRLEKSFAPDLPLLAGGHPGLNQAWTNLLDNAIDAAPQGGRIGVRTWMQGKEIYVSIRDNGSGIPSQCQAHIFDPFYTTKPMGEGTGIGLGIVYRIVEQHRGSIQFSSVPGNTEFLIRLPVEP
ncbi:MAG: ATP-binding protein [Acidobacteriaceae bacterium]|nr:ATP-binding protein [Acidobacteriaceae bacterium]